MITSEKFCVFHIVDNSVIPARNDPSYRASVRLRPLLDYMNDICMHYSLLVKQWQSISLVAGKVRNPIRQYLPNKYHARFETKVWLIPDSNTAYVLQCYVYEGAKYDPSSKVAGSGYDVVICLMEMSKCFHKGHHLFTDNLFTTYAVAAYLLERGSFLTGTMRRNQLHHLPNEITTAKPKVGQKIYFK